MTEVAIVMSALASAARVAKRTRKQVRAAAVVPCDIVWAELCAVSPSRKTFDEAISRLYLEFSPMNHDAAALAADIWRQYRSKGGNRTRVAVDLPIAAHAQQQCDRLLTREPLVARDRGLYREYFKKLRVIAPSA